MKEIRITFRGENFAAVSRSLIDLGVIFQVEAVEGGQALAPPDGRTEHASATRHRDHTKQRPAKTAAKPRATHGAASVNAKRGAGSDSGTARLRAIVERNRTSSGERERKAEGVGPLAPNGPSPANIPDDLSSKLLTYGEQKKGEE